MESAVLSYVGTHRVTGHQYYVTAECNGDIVTRNLQELPQIQDGLALKRLAAAWS